MHYTPIASTQFGAGLIAGVSVCIGLLALWNDRPIHAATMAATFTMAVCLSMWLTTREMS